MAEDNRERMTKALDTMLLELQVPRQIVSPVLRKLLQVRLFVFRVFIVSTYCSLILLFNCLLLYNVICNNRISTEFLFSLFFPGSLLSYFLMRDLEGS
jgi:hypothetical protein